MRSPRIFLLAFLLGCLCNLSAPSAPGSRRPCFLQPCKAWKGRGGSSCPFPRGRIGGAGGAGQLWVMRAEPSGEYALYRSQGLPMDGPASIDIRSAGEFVLGHAVGATSVPGDALVERLFELPPPYSGALRLLGGSEAELAAAREILKERRYTIEEEIPEGVWRSSAECVSGAASRPVWEASPFLQSVLSEQREWAAGYSSGGVALDLGCGAGREAVLMALELGAQWRVVACDNHEALRRTEMLAAREGVRVETLEVNLRRESLAHVQADFVHGCRFLHRPLLAEIRDGMLRAGGLVVWSTFLQGSGFVRNGRSLEEGELAKTFAQDGLCAVLRDQKGVLPTGAGDAEACFFVAQRL